MQSSPDAVSAASVASVASASASAVVVEPPVCRICHESGGGEELRAFCKCSGSLAPLHRSCLEKWLSTSDTSSCEICRLHFRTHRRPPSACEFLRSATGRERLTLWSDALCFVVLTPTTALGVYMCAVGVDHFVKMGRAASWETVVFVVLFFLFGFFYWLWFDIVFRSHYEKMKTWRRSHQNVRLLLDVQPGAPSDVNKIV